MWNLKHDTNEPVCETETESQTQEKTRGCWGMGSGERRSLRLELADVSFYTQDG